MRENERGRSFDRPPIANRRQKRAINAFTSACLTNGSGGVNIEAKFGGRDG